MRSAGAPGGSRMELAGGGWVAAEGGATVLAVSGDVVVPAVHSVSLVLAVGAGGAGTGE